MITAESNKEGLERICDSEIESRIPLTKLAVILGNDSAVSRAAASMGLLAKEPEVIKKHGHIEVLPVADVLQALKLWQDSEFLPIAGFFISPDNPEYEILSYMLGKVDTNKLAGIYDLAATPYGFVGRRDLYEKFNDALTTHGNGLSRLNDSADSAGSLEDKTASYGTLFRKAINNSGEGWVRGWKERYVTFNGTKQLAFRKNRRPAQPRTAISRDELSNTLEEIASLLQSKPSQSFAMRIVPNDPSRYATGRLAYLLKMLANSDGSVTRFMQHATEGAIGLFPLDKEFIPNVPEYWLKVHNSLGEAERVFRHYAELTRHGIAPEHRPIMAAEVGGGRYVILSEARVLTLTGDIAQILREVEPEFAERFVSEKTSLGIDLLVEYKNAVGRKLNETEIAQVLHSYQIKLLTAWKDMHLAAKARSNPSRKHEYALALQLLNYDISLWPDFLFGSIMDWKVYNDGHATGWLSPSPEQLSGFLGKKAAGNHSSSNAATLRASIRNSEAHLEYEDRDGSVLEDFSHFITAPQLQIPPQKQLDAYRRLLSRLLQPNLEMPLDYEQVSGLWHAYFAVDAFKATRKVQRTLHYIVNGDPHLYEGELAYYQQQMVKAPWAALMFFNDPQLSGGTDFNKQIAAVRQLYEAKEQWGKDEGIIPKSVNIQRWAAWLCSNKYLASLSYQTDQLEERLRVTR